MRKIIESTLGFKAGRIFEDLNSRRTLSSYSGGAERD
jgi:hypothetical protein